MLWEAPGRIRNQQAAEVWAEGAGSPSAASPARNQPGEPVRWPACVPLESTEEDVTGDETADNAAYSPRKTILQTNFSQFDV